MEELMVFGVSGIVVIKLLVNVAKKLGLASKYAFHAALVLGLLLSILTALAEQHPALLFWYLRVMVGLFAGAGATELYDWAKNNN